jgi:hypothetical protein
MVGRVCFVDAGLMGGWKVEGLSFRLRWEAQPITILRSLSLVRTPTFDNVKTPRD